MDGDSIVVVGGGGGGGGGRGVPLRSTFSKERLFKLSKASGEQQAWNEQIDLLWLRYGDLEICEMCEICSTVMLDMLLMLLWLLG